jgi:hypothetical protein
MRIKTPLFNVCQHDIYSAPYIDAYEALDGEVFIGTNIFFVVNLANMEGSMQPKHISVYICEYCWETLADLLSTLLSRRKT